MKRRKYGYLVGAFFSALLFGVGLYFKFGGGQ